MTKYLTCFVMVLVLSQNYSAKAATPPAFTSPPVASSAIPLAGQIIIFTAIASDPQGLAITYIYDYGDGTVNTLGSHVYTLPGSYTVRITASNCLAGTTTTIPITVKGFANLWLKKQSIKVGKAGTEAWQAQFIYNADRTSPFIFDASKNICITSLGSIPAIQVNPAQFKGASPRFSFKSAKGALPSTSTALDESAQTLTVNAKADTFSDTVPAVLHNFVKLGASEFALDVALDANGKFTANSGYRTAAFVVSAGTMSIKAAGKDSVKFSMLLGDPAFQFPGASGAATVRMRVINSAGTVVVDKDFSSIVKFAAGKFKSGKDTAAAKGTFGYDSLKGAMNASLSKATLTGLLSASEEHVRVDVLLGDQTYTTHVTFFAPKAGAYNTKMGKGSKPAPGSPGVTPAGNPTVTATSPVAAATGVALNQKLTATFSAAMDPATITASSFTLQQGATVIPGAIAVIGTTATFTPTVNLTANSPYTATLTTALKDAAGNPLAVNFAWCFFTGVTVDTTLPKVISTQPANTATGVAINPRIGATFSKDMDPSSITATSFTLQQGATAVAGAVSYTGTTATFAPASSLALNTVFTATITTAVKDLAGNAPASKYVWTFTTGTLSDTTPPTVTSTNPVNGAIGVALNKTINATFSKPLNPSTLSTAHFTVTDSNAVSIAGSVAYDSINNIVSFTPSINLAASTTFTALLTTGITDLAGNALASNFTWSFTTGTQVAQPPIVFGSAGVFGILAGSTVTSVGPTQINGDLGVSPGAAVTGFPPGNVNGAIHAGDNAAAQAKSDLLAAYNDGAARLGAAVLPGNLGGLTFTPGLYNNQSSSGISGTGPQGILTLDAQGDPNAVFIFQMASTLITDSGTSVVLAGGAKEGNIYWQVGSSATLGTNSIFKGNVLADQSITLTTGATLDGRALTRIGAVTLNSNTVTKPAP